MYGAPARTKLEPLGAITGGYKRLGRDLQVPARTGWQNLPVGTAISSCIIRERMYDRHIGGLMKPRSIVIVTALCIGLAGAAYTVTNGHCRFDKEIWLASRQMNDHEEVMNKAAPRRCMTADLEWRYLTKGIDKKAVVELLGTPDDDTKENRYSYDLGMVWIDYCFLDVHFNDAGELESTRSYCNG